MRNEIVSPARRGARLIASPSVALILVASLTAQAATLDTIGVNLLRATTTNLDGTGIRVAQVEAPGSSNDWEVDPGDSRVMLPVSDFTWFDVTSSTAYPNGLGVASPHSGGVAGYWYGLPGGVSTNVAHIDNYEANYFFFGIPLPLATNDVVVNQSFAAPTTYQAMSDPNYDNFAAVNNVLFVSAAGDGGTVLPPSTCYNGISVAAYQSAGSSVGPTPDNSRAKPDITAPADATSDSAPLVSGAAVLLAEAGLRGDGGTNTNSASDSRTLKALLLNGAIKPADWANPSPSPLDPVYGAGVLNVFNSYHQLIGGKHGFIASTNIITGDPHPPTGATGNVSSLSGWDFNGISNTSGTDSLNHYCFNLTNGTSNAIFTGTMTLVWKRHYNKTNINDLDLFLYNMDTGSLIAASTSRVDNVEHIYIPKLPAGRYDVEVFKNGGAITSTNELYALAFEFFAMSLKITPSGGGQLLTWPVYPAGFVIQGTYSVQPPSWFTYLVTPVVTNNQNSYWVTSPSGTQYFRLMRAVP